MEVLGVVEFEQLGLNSSYNPDQNSFVQLNGGGVPVREVEDKQITVVSKEGVTIVDKDNNKLFDTFTGIIDGVTGEPLHGVRQYVVSGEIYEGKFNFNGMRHGKGAIVKNIKLPAPREVFSQDLLLTGENNNDFEGKVKIIDQKQQEGRKIISGVDQRQEEETVVVSSPKSNFFGTYEYDEPSFGNLVTDTYIYRGPFKNGYFHGEKSELIRQNGYRYIGDFQEGLFHGMGQEIDPEVGDYQGEFCNGMKQGVGTFKEYKAEDRKEGGEDTKETNNLIVIGGILETIEEETSKDGVLLLDEVRQKVENVFKITEVDETRKESMEDISYDRYVYSGHYNSDQRHGDGSEWTPGPDGEMYSGQFYTNQRHGHGSLKSRSTGIIYEGKWCRGQVVAGNGWRILYPNGDIYCGYVENFEPHGYGMYQNELTGDLYVGHWKDGHRAGNAICCSGRKTDIIASEEWMRDNNNDEIVSIKRLEKTDKTLGQIASFLRNSTNEEEDSCQNAGDATEEDQNSSNASKKNNGNSCFSPILTKSIESSLQIIVSQQQEEDLESEPETISQSDNNNADSDELNNTSEELNNTSEESTAELHSYANRDIYLGALDPESFKRTGYGVYISRTTSCSYTGLFENNRRNGFGILIHSQFGKYAGEFHQDKKHGKGTLILKDLSSYHGGFVNGVFEGKGTLRQQDGGVYVGEWKAGLRNGEGMETMVDGQVYKGTFKNGKREGNATLLEKYAGKMIYRGQWVDDEYHGEGVVVDRYRSSASSQVVQVLNWEGQFESGKKHGYGVMSNEIERSEWKGNWNHDRPVSGKWRIRHADGSIFSGHAEVLDGYLPRDRVLAIPEGFGTFKYANGDVYIGNFEYGIRSGNGSCQFASTGENYEGAWKNDEPDKDTGGVLTSISGEILEEYKNSFF